MPYRVHAEVQVRRETLAAFQVFRVRGAKLTLGFMALAGLCGPVGVMMAAGIPSADRDGWTAVAIWSLLVGMIVGVVGALWLRSRRKAWLWLVRVGDRIELVVAGYHTLVLPLQVLISQYDRSTSDADYVEAHLELVDGGGHRLCLIEHADDDLFPLFPGCPRSIGRPPAGDFEIRRGLAELRARIETHNPFAVDRALRE